MARCQAAGNASSRITIYTSYSNPIVTPSLLLEAKAMPRACAKALSLLNLLYFEPETQGCPNVPSRSCFGFRRSLVLALSGFLLR